MAKTPQRAFILAAGIGARLRPYTDTMPKPLVPVGGRAIIDHVLDRLVEAGVTHVVINLHYKGDMIEKHLAARTDVKIEYSREESLMDTGGGIKKALKLLGDEPFFVVSGDSFWHDGPSGNALQNLASAWDSAKMDLLLLLQPLSSMTLTQGRGDYHLNNDGTCARARDKGGTHMWTSVRICSKKLFDGTPDTPFSFLDLMDWAEKAGRLRAAEHDGDWHHISTPADLERVNAALQKLPRKTGGICP